jgi:hypothetical protein
MRLQVRKTTLALLVGALLSSAWPATSQAAVPAQGSGPITECGTSCDGEIVIPGDPSDPGAGDGSGSPPGDADPDPYVPTDGTMVSMMCARIDYGSLAPGAAGVSLLNCQGDPPLVSMGLIYQDGILLPYSSAVCLAPGICQPGQTAPTYPCLPSAADDTITFDCEFEQGNPRKRLAVSSRCPVNRVERTPYPRALVNAPTWFRLQHEIWGLGGAGGVVAHAHDGIGADGEPTHGAAFHLQLAIRSQRLSAGVRWADDRVVGPEWTFYDGNGSSGAGGDVARFTWRYSSFEQPLLGVGADRRTNRPDLSKRLPAWEVIMTTSCGHEVAWRYRVAETENIIGQCRYYSGKPNDMAQTCGSIAADGSGWYAEVTQRLRWRVAAGQNDFPAWQTVDLRWFGRGRSYATMRETQEYGIVRDQIFDSGLVRSSLWVPVIEVQSVLRSDECHANPARCPGVGPP